LMMSRSFLVSVPRRMHRFSTSSSLSAGRS
jgi:hypothetical protein